MNRSDAPDPAFGVRHAPYACDPAHSRGRLIAEPEWERAPSSSATGTGSCIPPLSAG